MKTLNELIEEQVVKFWDVVENVPEDEEDEVRVKIAETFLKNALKEIALQSIEATEKIEVPYPGEADPIWLAGWNKREEEAKQRAGVFLGEASVCYHKTHQSLKDCDVCGEPLGEGDNQETA